MTREHHLPVSLHMKSNDLSKKASLTLMNQTFDRMRMNSTHRHIIFFLIRNITTTRYYNIVSKRKVTKEWYRKRNTIELILLLTSSSCVGTKHAISFSTICFSFNHCRKESKNESNLGQIFFLRKFFINSVMLDCTIKPIFQELNKMSMSSFTQLNIKTGVITNSGNFNKR